MSGFQAQTLPRGMALALSALLRAVLAVVGFFMVIGLMVFALIFAVTLVVWALVRGRRPQPMRFAWQSFRTPGAFRRGRSAPRAPQGEVVDVEAREVTPWQQR